MIRRGDPVKVNGQIAFVFGVIRKKETNPPWIILDRKVGPYWSYRPSQVIKLKIKQKVKSNVITNI